MEQVRIYQGQNELSKRDHITMVLHYGQIDRWVSFEKGEIILNSDNSDQIAIGQEVKISETLFMKWLKLTTLVDRSSDRKQDHHVRNKVTSIAKQLGYSSKSGFYKVLKPLYEVGLIDLKETNIGLIKMIDIFAYPYPIYSDSPICVLRKTRSWNDRESFGFTLANLGVNSRSEQKCTGEENKSEQVLKQKCTGLVHKSERELVHKSGRGPVHKSGHSNIYNLSKDNNISKDHNILSHYQELESSVQESLKRFKEEFDVTDDEMTEIILRLENFKPRSKQYASHRKYLQKTLATVRDEIQRSKKQAAKEGVMPKWLLNELEQEGDESQEFVDKPSNSEEDSRSFEDMLEELRMLREKRRAN